MLSVAPSVISFFWASLTRLSLAAPGARVDATRAAAGSVRAAHGRTRPVRGAWLEGESGDGVFSTTTLPPYSLLKVDRCVPA